jgi:WS/DGAT/MGAT family acyltransferase
VAYAHYDRLSALDATFLGLEDANVHMHVAAVAVYQAEALRTAEGGLDVDRIRSAVESALGETPRFRQKLARIPLFDHPVWVDDPRFNLAYHVRHTALPPPGDLRQLKRLAGRILSQKLDRGKPLWEMWVIQGVEGDRFAILAKAHHCMVDGISGLDLLARMMRLDPDPTVEPAAGWIPRPPPDASRMLVDEVWHRASFPASLAREALGSITRPQDLAWRLWENAAALGETLRGGLRATTSTPLNEDIGPYRRFDWTRHDLGGLNEIRKRFGGTLNDVVLATAAGAIGRFLEARGVDLRDSAFRAQVPVSTRVPGDRKEGNRVVMLMADLPVDERDPVKRLERVRKAMGELKRSRQRFGVQLIEEVSDRTLPGLWMNFARIATRQRSFNVVITNIPGPKRPVYLLGARMEGIYPLVPLAQQQALGIAVFSYDGGLHWGLHADWDALPDLHDLTVGLDEEFERLLKLAAREG